MNFPIIYCNGDSYSDENYHQSLNGRVYANAVADYCNGFVINKAISGSCNRRIIRTTIHDMIHQRQLNPDQKIIALIGLSFEIRSEIWVEDLDNTVPEESNFRTHAFSLQTQWRENLLLGNNIDTPNRYKMDTKFYNEYSRGRAYFYSPYAERINLLTDLLMLKSLLESINVDFLIFQSPKAEKLGPEYLIDFLKQQLYGDLRFFDLDEFGFCNWCLEQNFTPLDYLDRPEIGHYNFDAHKSFAHKVIIPRLQELNIL